MGDTIDRFSGPLEELVWVQYAALQHEDLFGKENHREFQEQLKLSARKLKSIVSREISAQSERCCMRCLSGSAVGVPAGQA